MYDTQDTVRKKSIQREIEQACTELNNLLTHTRVQQFPEIYAQHCNRLKSALKDAETRLANIEQYEQAKEKIQAFHKEFSTHRVTETVEQKKARFGATVSTGLTTNFKNRKDLGGWTELAKLVHQHVLEASNHGTVRVTGEDIAHQFDTTPRTANRWLERPEFLQTARLLGRR